MKEADILDKISSVRPNPYGSYLGDYLKSLDIRIRTEILGETNPTYSPDNLALGDKDFALYELFIFSVIDLLNGEYGRYQNSRAAFECAYSRLSGNTSDENNSENSDGNTDTNPGGKPDKEPERSFRIW